MERRRDRSRDEVYPLGVDRESHTPLEVVHGPGKPGVERWEDTSHPEACGPGVRGRAVLQACSQERQVGAGETGNLLVPPELEAPGIPHPTRERPTGCGFFDVRWIPSQVRALEVPTAVGPNGICRREGTHQGQPVPASRG